MPDPLQADAAIQPPTVTVNPPIDEDCNPDSTIDQQLIDAIWEANPDDDDDGGP